MRGVIPFVESGLVPSRCRGCLSQDTLSSPFPIAFLIQYCQMPLLQYLLNTAVYCGSDCCALLCVAVVDYRILHGRFYVWF